MPKRSRLSRIVRKPYTVTVNDVPKYKVKSPEEYENILRKHDRKKDKVRLVC